MVPFTIVLSRAVASDWRNSERDDCEIVTPAFSRDDAIAATDCPSISKPIQTETLENWRKSVIQAPADASCSRSFAMVACRSDAVEALI
jgi:hypothetical protein